MSDSRAESDVMASAIEVAELYQKAQYELLELAKKIEGNISPIQHEEKNDRELADGMCRLLGCEDDPVLIANTMKDIYRQLCENDVERYCFKKMTA